MRSITRSIFNPLVLITVVFLGSAALRATDGVSPVFASADGKGHNETIEETPPACIGLPDLEVMYRSLQLEKEELNTEKQAFEQSSQRLEQAKQLVKESYEELTLMNAELDAERRDFEERKRNVSAAAQTDLDRLVDVYEAMKPKDASLLFETMTADFAAGFIGRMQPDIAADILAGVSPDFAYAVSVVIAGQNVLKTKPTEADEK